MPSEEIDIGETKVVICTRGRKLKRCTYCLKPHKFLCDYPVAKTKKGKLKTCDRPLCSDHTKKGVSDDVDFCREHYPLAKAAYERRQGKLKK